jgi:hypothetical protein
MGIRRLEGLVEPMRKIDITQRKHQDPKEVLEWHIPWADG